MATTDIDPVVARLVNRISTVANCGLVHTEDPFSRDDLRPLVVSTIAGEPTMRAWWVSGPSMRGTRVVQSTAGPILRAWTYSIFGCEGLAGSGPQQRLRNLALAVTDAIDRDPDLGGTVHRSDLCTWRLIENRAAWRGIAASWVEITKTVHTLSTP